MRVLYLDPVGGLAGDMFLGALLAVGGEREALTRGLAPLSVGHRLEVTETRRGGVQALRVEVTVPAGGKPHRRLPEVEAVLARAALAPGVAARARAVFRRLAAAEARVHGATPATVALHEAAMDDALVDVVGTCLLLESLQVEAIHAAPPPLGTGETTGAHGRLPVPAPAVLELLRGLPVRPTAVPVERVTPTGAALAAALVDRFAPPPPGRLLGVGYGAGARDLPGEVNVLRVLLLETAGPAAADTVVVLETVLDDMTPEGAAGAAARLRARGAVEVYFTPVVLKKGRPGFALTVLVPPAAEEAVVETLLVETSTFGLRRGTAERRLLGRERVEVPTPWGRVGVKVGRLGERVVKAAPEFEDCRRVAARAGVALQEVYAAALAAYRAGRRP